jgi:hypothetical protein
MPKVVSITLTRDNKFTAFCDTGAFWEGDCNLEQSKYCPHNKSVCCLVCDELIDGSCDTYCIRVDPDVDG